MTIITKSTGKYGRIKKYDVVEGQDTIATFNSLLTAGLVLRYLQGATLSADDESAAKSALQSIDEQEG